MKAKKKAKKVCALGKMLTALPAASPLLYPLYLAAQLDTVEKTYCSAQIPVPFDGFRIVFVSDIHYGALFGENRVRALAERINAMEADIVLLGGDYGENAQGAVDFFQLHPGFHGKLGVFAALGNHDRTHPESAFPILLDTMRQEGMIPLVNDVYFIKNAGTTLALASTDDYLNGNPDLPKVKRLCEKADFTIFFPHNPDILPLTYEMEGGPFYHLALCGHTHGGQVTVCGHAIKSSSEWGDRFLSGWYQEKGIDIMVSNGVGTSVLPVRLGARPQVHLLTLKSASASEKARITP